MGLERNYKPKLIKRIKRLFPGCWVLLLDTGYQQGVPDLLILFGAQWALLEVKREAPGPDDFEPNQEWFLDEFDSMSFAACIYPKNEEAVLRGLQQAFQPTSASRVPQRQ